jgi:hypothetical protein
MRRNIFRLFFVAWMFPCEPTQLIGACGVSVLLFLLAFRFGMRIWPE